jgi:predicted nuclease with TOPRIM domain
LTPELYETIVRIVDQRVGEVKVTREDFDKLTKTVSELAGTVRELAEAQKRTDERLQELAGAQKDLAEAQRRTEDSLHELSEAVKDLAKAVGRLSDTVGYGLEDVARVMLPPWLERHERVRVEELERRFVQVDGESVEVNLYGEGLRARASVTVIGEARSRIHAGDVKEFAANVEKIQKSLKDRRILPLMFGYWIHPSATSLAKTLRIRLIASYQR